MKLWTNGYIHTLENEEKVYNHMITHHGKVLSFNKDLYDQYDEIIDLKGSHVYPGFVDAHLHILGYGEKLSQIDLSIYQNKDDMIDCIKTHINQHSTYYGMYDDLLTKHDLDTISLDHPIIIKHQDYHKYTVNSFVLKTCHINLDKQTLDLTEMIEVNKVFLSYSNSQLTSLIKHAYKQLYAFGLTGGHSDDLHYFNGYKDTLKAFKDAIADMPFRTQLLVHYKELSSYTDLFLDQNAFLQLGPVKIFFDGTLTSKTALLNHDYFDETHHGKQEIPTSEFIQLIKRIRSLSLPVAIHVIGDRGLDDLINILKAYPPKQGLHERLIHASFISKHAMKALETMPIIIDIQPQFIESDFPKGLAYFRKAPDFIYPFQTLLNHGITICGSSDAPVEIPNPLLGMYAAITRNGLSKFPSNEHEKLSRFEALKLYTRYANIPTYHQNNRGLIKENYIADFTIFKEDLLTIPVEDFLKIKTKMTVIDEKIVYQQ
ncbi:amidohydrolase [Mycoplasmatota bacterium]|nr:amidohydrolase [Mycoplasmatota bacterium]